MRLPDHCCDCDFEPEPPVTCDECGLAPCACALRHGYEYPASEQDNVYCEACPVEHKRFACHQINGRWLCDAHKNEAAGSTRTLIGVREAHPKTRTAHDKHQTSTSLSQPPHNFREGVKPT